LDKDTSEKNNPYLEIQPWIDNLDDLNKRDKYVYNTCKVPRKNV